MQSPCDIPEAASRIEESCCKIPSIALQLLPELARSFTWGHIHHHQIDWFASHVTQRQIDHRLSLLLRFLLLWDLFRACSHLMSRLEQNSWVWCLCIPDPERTECWASFYMVRGGKEKSLYFSPKRISQHAPRLGIPKIFTDLTNLICLTRIMRIYILYNMSLVQVLCHWLSRPAWHSLAHSVVHLVARQAFCSLIKFK